MGMLYVAVVSLSSRSLSGKDRENTEPLYTSLKLDNRSQLRHEHGNISI